MKKYCLTTGILLAAALTACGQQASWTPSSSIIQSSASEPDPASAPVSSSEIKSKITAGPILYIGLSNSLKEVPYDGEQTADALIAALEDETGWNLGLAAPVSKGPTKNSLSVAFATDSAIYSASQNDGNYQVPDAKDFIYMVLNSTSETLLQNLSVDNVYFTAPNGGDLDFEI